MSEKGSSSSKGSSRSRTLEKTIVFDLGTGYSKVGFAGDASPIELFPSVVGRKRQGGIEYVGDDAMSKRAMLKLEYPIDHGIVTNFEEMETILIHTFARYLSVDPKSHPLFITEAPLNPLSNREKLAELLFENFGTPRLYIGSQGHSTLYASGRVSGLVFESGEGVSQVIPVIEGYPLKHAINRLDLAGREISDNLRLILTERGYRFSTVAEKEMIREMKENLAFVSLDYEGEMNGNYSSADSLDKTYELPDGQIITIGNERFRAPEMLFQPSIGGSNLSPIHHLIQDSINKCELDFQREMCGNIVVGGGTGKLPGLTKRIKNELLKLNAERRYRIIAFKDPHLSAWKGSAIVANLSSFQNMFVTKREFAECGPNILHQKYF